GKAKVAAIGPATAEALGEIGLRADFVPSQFVAESVAEEWPDREMTGKRVLLPRAKEARGFLPDKLAEMGAAVDVIPAYETVIDGAAAEQIRGELMSGEIDAITFTSSSTVKNFVESIGNATVKEIADKVTIAAIGPITAETARELGLSPQIVA